MQNRLMIVAVGALSLAGAANAQIWATQAHLYTPGTQEDGSALPVERTDTSKALGIPENDDSFPDHINFVSLGFGGSLVLSFGQPFKDNIYWYETTWNANTGHFEHANLFVGSGNDPSTASYYLVANLSNLIEGVPASLATVQGNTGITHWKVLNGAPATSKSDGTMWQLQAGWAKNVKGMFVILHGADDTLVSLGQTRHLAAMKTKLGALLSDHSVHVVFPIAEQRTIARMAAGGDILSRRRSPKRGTIYDIFPELVSLPALIHNPHFSLELLLIHEEQIWRDDGQGSWRRRRWSIYDRRLLATFMSIPLLCAEDFAALLPTNLVDGFDTCTLAAAIGQPVHVAQKMAYCLRHMGILAVRGKQGNSLLYARCG
mgnify:CR=1 FL=1